MSKVFALGVSPLPIENEKVLNGPGIRTWQFVKPLIDDGHRVCLVCIQTPGVYKKGQEGLVEQIKIKGLTYYSISQRRSETPSYAQKIYDSFKPDCIFSISSSLPSDLAVHLKTDRPIWFDRGDLMSEAQLKAFVDNKDLYLESFCALEELVLRKGDIFSSVSSPQKFATIGRLGTIGRLNGNTLGYEFVHVVPCAIDDGSYRHTRDIIRGRCAKRGDFIILWSGGYNTWADIDTLFFALEEVMAKNKKVKFVSIGGAIPGQDEKTYLRFLKLIEGSQYRNRYILLGWVPTEELPNIYLESNLGINIDRDCYEVALGSRHRLLGWIKAGLPVLTTTPSELTRSLCTKKMAFSYPTNNSKALAEEILRLCSKKALLAEYAKRARVFAEKEFSFEATTREFREWICKPSYAPDKRYTTKEAKSRHRRFLYNVEVELKRKITRLMFKQRAQKDHLFGLEKERQQQKDHIFGLEMEQRQQKDHISSLKMERQIQGKHITNFMSANKNLQEQASYLNERIKDVETTCKNYQDQVSDLLDCRKDQGGHIANLDRHIAHIEEIKANQTDYITKLEGIREDSQTHIADLEEDREKLKAALNKIHNSRVFRFYKAIKRIVCLRRLRRD